MSVVSIYDSQSRSKILARLALPAILEQILLTLISYADTAMVGSLGPAATAAVGLIAPVTWLIGGVLQGVGVGYSVLVAHAIGARDIARARHVIVQSVLAILLCGSGMLALFLGLSPIIPRWLGAKPEVLPEATAYLKIYSLSLLPNACMCVLGPIIRCMGSAKLPLVFNTLANFLNIALNFLLIYPTREIWGYTVWGAGMGVAGAAWGTTISITIAGIAMLLIFFKRKDEFRLSIREDWHPDRQVICQAARLGLPYIVERSAINLGMLVTTRIISDVGTIAVAANHIAVTAEGLCYLPAYGISSAATTLVGQSVGAKDAEGADKYGILAEIWGFGLCAVTGAALFVTAPWLASLFNENPLVVAEATLVLRIVAPIEPFFASFIVLSGALRGAGDTRFPMFLCLGSMWCVRILFSFILVNGFGLGLAGAWSAMAADLLLRGTVCIFRWRSGRWKKYALKE